MNGRIAKLNALLKDLPDIIVPGGRISSAGAPHRHGVIHRYINPESILWLDGQAMAGRPCVVSWIPNEMKEFSGLNPDENCGETCSGDNRSCIV